MSEVTVPFGEDAAETATLLLASAENLHGNQGLVRTAEGAFVVPKDVADDAGVDYQSDDADGEPEAKESAAKKSAAKK
jgi:hypothetical protein